MVIFSRDPFTFTEVIVHKQNEYGGSQQKQCHNNFLLLYTMVTGTYLSPVMLRGTASKTSRGPMYLMAQPKA